LPDNKPSPKGDAATHNKRSGNAPKRKRGRQSKLTPGIIEAICKGVSLGMPMSHAAQACGIRTNTFNSWMQRADEDGTLYQELALAISRARAEGERRLLEIIEQAAPKDYRAAQWILEHAYSHTYGRTEVEQRHIGEIVIRHEGFAVVDDVDENSEVGATA